MTIRIVLGLLLCCATASAQSAVIYKCRQSGDVISYQDKPCPGRQIGVIRTSTPPPPSPATPAAPAAPAAPSSVRASPPMPSQAPRPAYKCTRVDGTVYYSGESRTRRRLVDASESVADSKSSPPPPPGKAWAEERCEAASRAETCAFYQERMALNDSAQQRAKGDELRKLTREGQRLRAIHNHRCVR